MQRRDPAVIGPARHELANIDDESARNVNGGSKPGRRGGAKTSHWAVA
jgi:hypothetical protein